VKTYTHPTYACATPIDVSGAPHHWPVVVAGAGPAGLCAAIDLAQRGIDVLVLDEDNTVSVGSRAICWAKRTLEIFDRLGCGDRIVGKGVEWSVGKVFFRNEQIYQFDLLPESGHRRPAFINLQQYWVEQFLVERCASLPQVELRWQNRVVGVARETDRVSLRVAAAEGEYTVHADWLIAADGARSPVRGMLGLDTEGVAFRDRFLIADVVMHSDFPSERWFWFDPPFHPNQSALLHRQADNVWRIDFQLGPDADPDEEKKPANISARLRAMLGDAVEFDVEWSSVYTFQCRRMRSFRHGRALFVGDAAHVVSPFGARGANSGIQDVDNLVWKLELVMAGQAPESLLDSYDIERTFAADENIRHSARSTDFISPKSDVSRSFRDAALLLAKRHAFARRFVNSGRLSLPTVLDTSPLTTHDGDAFSCGPPPGAAAVDAPVRGPRGDWLLSYLEEGFTLLMFDAPLAADAIEALAGNDNPCIVVEVADEPLSGRPTVEDCAHLAAARYDARPGTCYLFRPDQHVCARWRSFDLHAVRDAVARAAGVAFTEESVAA
jgi:3-(3-hydroxy-phenyl)propionate hydroxylase